MIKTLLIAGAALAITIHSSQAQNCVLIDANEGYTATIHVSGWIRPNIAKEDDEWERGSYYVLKIDQPNILCSAPTIGIDDDTGKKWNNKHVIIEGTVAGNMSAATARIRAWTPGRDFTTINTIDPFDPTPLPRPRPFKAH